MRPSFGSNLWDLPLNEGTSPFRDYSLQNLVRFHDAGETLKIVVDTFGIMCYYN